MRSEQFTTKRFNIIAAIFFSFGLLLATVLPAAAQVTGKIAFICTVDGNTELYSINTDGTNFTRVSFNSIHEVPEIDISRDGSRVVYEPLGSNNVFFMNTDGSNVRQLTFSDDAFNPAISPDGTKVAYDARRNNNGDIYMINADGTNETRVTTSTFGDQRPSFSPDGTKIIFDSNRFSLFGLTNLYVINTNGTNETRLTNTFFEFGARYSPDGSRIVYQGRTEAGQNSENEIFIMNADGTNQTQLTANAVKDQHPTVSLDGTMIAFDRPDVIPGLGTRVQIYVMNLNGTGIRQITDFAAQYGSVGSPRWLAAPNATVSGRITTPDGRGLRNATVKMTDANNVTRTVTTSSFGFYTFDNVATGQSYTIAISSRLYRFQSRVVQVSGDLANVDFVRLE